MVSSVEKAFGTPGCALPPFSAIWFKVAVAVASEAGVRPRTKVEIP